MTFCKQFPNHGGSGFQVYIHYQHMEASHSLSKRTQGALIDYVVLGVNISSIITRLVLYCIVL